VGFEIPENVAALSDEDLASAIDTAYEEGTALSSVEDADMTDEQIERAEALAAFLREAKASQAERAEKAAQRAERIAAAKAAVTPPEDNAEDEDDEAEETPESPEEPEDQAPVVEVEVEETPIVEAEEDVEETPEPVAVAASAAPTAPARRKKNAVARTAQAPAAETPAVDSRPRPSIIASADALDIPAGKGVESLEDLVPSLIRRWQSFAPSSPYGVGENRSARQRFGLASIAVQNPLNDTDIPDASELLRRAADESRLTSERGAGSLVAAGGWCAPSETVYDLCGPLASNDGYVDLPEVTLRRGGIRFTKGIDWATLFAGDLSTVGGTQTEAEAEAGEEKDCITLECPDFVDHRMDAEYLCATIPLLTEAGYPELVRDFLQGMVLAHQVKMRRKDLADMLTLAGTAVSVAGTFPNALSILHALELAILGERQRHNMAEGATLEVVVPTWVRAVIRADLANRTGVEMTNVSNAQIDAHFSTRGARVQFVKRWPGLDLDLSGGVAVAYPSTVEALIYPAGTFVRGQADVIRLDAVYDAPSLKTNIYTGLFVEQGRKVFNRCYDAKRISLPVNLTGRTAAADIVAEWGATEGGGDDTPPVGE